MAKEFKLRLGSAENITGKGKNAVYQHFLFYASYSRLLKLGIVWLKG